MMDFERLKVGDLVDLEDYPRLPMIYRCRVVGLNPESRLVKVETVRRKDGKSPRSSKARPLLSEWVRPTNLRGPGLVTEPAPAPPERTQS